MSKCLQNDIHYCEKIKKPANIASQIEKKEKTKSRVSIDSTDKNLFKLVDSFTVFLVMNGPTSDC